MGTGRRVALPALLVLAGCLEMEQTIAIGADGSGTHSLELEMSQGAKRAVAAFATVSAPGLDLERIGEREAVARELGDRGLELVAHESSVEGGRRSLKVEAGFGSLEELARTPLFGSSCEWEFATGPRPDLTPPLAEGRRRIVLYPRGEEAWKEGRRRARELLRGDHDPMRVRAWLEEQKRRLKGLDVALHLEVPGLVDGITRNLERTGPRRVTARVRIDDVREPEDLVRWLAPRFLIDYVAR